MAGSVVTVTDNTPARILQAFDRSIEIVGVVEIGSVLDHTADDCRATQGVVAEALPSPRFPGTGEPADSVRDRIAELRGPHFVIGEAAAIGAVRKTLIDQGCNAT